ncbi:MAG: four helix bundle protein [Flavobacterium sp.]|nr:four helix bundle protein [Flavobacterium sp.]
MAKIATHKDLRVYQASFQAAMAIYQLSKSFPSEEKFSLTDQIRRSSRSVCANLAEAFRKRRYPKNFVSKLSDCEAEAAETHVWLDFALACDYVTIEEYEKLYKEYDMILGMLVRMIVEPEKWNL